MRFKFKLEALRRYRRFQEETLQKDLSEAQRVHENESMKLLRLVNKRKKREAEMKKEQTQSTTSLHMSIYSNFLKRITDDIANQRLELARAEADCEQKREALVLAMQKRKALEKLKEDGFKAYMQELNQEEAKFINEMAISRFNLKSR